MNLWVAEVHPLLRALCGCACGRVLLPATGAAGVLPINFQCSGRKQGRGLTVRRTADEGENNIKRDQRSANNTIQLHPCCIVLLLWGSRHLLNQDLEVLIQEKSENKQINRLRSFKLVYESGLDSNVLPSQRKAADVQVVNCSMAFP